MATSPNDPWRISWEGMHACGWWYLNHSDELTLSTSQGRPIGGLPRLRLWNDAKGFQNESEPTTLTVFEGFVGGETRELVVREAMWQSRFDLSRVHDAVARSKEPTLCQPTVTVRDGEVPPDEFARFLQEASIFQLPLVWFSNSESVTTDVGSVGLEFFSRDQPPAVFRLQWSYKKPEAWKPVEVWFERMKQFLESYLLDEKPQTELGAGVDFRRV